MTRVLFVDDDRAMCEAMASELHEHGLDVAWQNTALKAFDLLTKEDFDVVITDLNMGGMNGIDLCQRVAESRRDVPVIVVTAKRPAQPNAAERTPPATPIVMPKLELAAEPLVIRL